jgi:hypothetical protein
MLEDWDNCFHKRKKYKPGYMEQFEYVRAFNDSGLVPCNVRKIINVRNGNGESQFVNNSSMPAHIEYCNHYLETQIERCKQFTNQIQNEATATETRLNQLNTMLEQLKKNNLNSTRLGSGLSHYQTLLPEDVNQFTNIRNEYTHCQTDFIEQINKINRNIQNDIIDLTVE